MIYLLHGEDTFSLRERLAEMKEAVGTLDLRDVNTVTLAGTTSFGELVANANTVPFLSDKRIVIVEGLLGKFDKKGGSADDAPDTGAWEGLGQALETLPPTTDLIFVEATVSPQNALAKAIRPYIKEQKFDVPGPRELRQWIATRAQAEGIQIEQRAVDTMANSIGGNLPIIVTELQKLGLFVNGGAITHEDVESMVPYTKEANIFATVDAMLEGRSDVAIRLVNQILQAGSSPGYVLTMMARQTRLLILAKEIKSQRVPQEEHGKRLGLRGFPLRKTLEQTERFSMDRLAEIHGALLEADYAMKTSSADEELVLDTLIADVASRPAGGRPPRHAGRT